MWSFVRSKQIGCALLVLFVVGSMPFFAKAQTNIFAICEYSSQQCIDQIDPEIAKAEPKSALWYELTLLKLDTLFALQYDKLLWQATSQLVLDQTSPASFRARLYIYHAKMLTFNDSKLQAEHYLDKAVKLLESLNRSAPNPLTIIRLVNVQTYVGADPLVGYETLQKLEAQFSRSHDQLMKYELYNNLGHGAHFLKRLEESQLHREKALIAIQKTTNKAKLAEGHYNLARVMAYRELWADAEPHLVHAEGYYHEIGDQLLTALARMHLSEALYRQQKVQAATSMFATVDIKKIPAYANEHLTRISALFTQVKSAG